MVQLHSAPVLLLIFVAQLVVRPAWISSGTGALSCAEMSCQLRLRWCLQKGTRVCAHLAAKAGLWTLSSTPSLLLCP